MATQNHLDNLKGPHEYTVKGEYKALPVTGDVVEYPKMKYHVTDGQRIVANSEAEDALGEGWSSKPIKL